MCSKRKKTIFILQFTLFLLLGYKNTEGDYSRVKSATYAINSLKTRLLDSSNILFQYRVKERAYKNRPLVQTRITTHRVRIGIAPSLSSLRDEQNPFCVPSSVAFDPFREIPQ